MMPEYPSILGDEEVYDREMKILRDENEAKLKRQKKYFVLFAGIVIGSMVLRLITI